MSTLKDQLTSGSLTKQFEVGFMYKFSVLTLKLLSVSSCLCFCYCLSRMDLAIYQFATSWAAMGMKQLWCKN